MASDNHIKGEILIDIEYNTNARERGPEIKYQVLGAGLVSNYPGGTKNSWKLMKSS